MFHNAYRTSFVDVGFQLLRQGPNVWKIDVSFSSSAVFQQHHQQHQQRHGLYKQQQTENETKRNKFFYES